MAFHSGYFSFYYNSSVTHIIAESIPESKRTYFGKNACIVKPKWISESLRLAIRQPTAPYVLMSSSAPTSLTQSLTTSTSNDVSSLLQPQRPLEKGLPNTMDTTFISSYFSSSRLHHLSFWRCELRSKVHSLLTSLNSSSTSLTTPTWKESPPWSSVPKVFLHCDLDCFFVAVSLLSDPNLIGKPVAISHSQSGSGEIAACSYEARKYGVKASMWTSTAKSLCPDLIVKKYENFKIYEELSMKMYKVFAANLPSVSFIHPVSIDEAILDISFSPLPPDDLCSLLRSQIQLETGLASSCGVGSGPRIARLGTAKAKPNGQLVITPDRTVDVISGLSVGGLPGIGGSLEERLNSIGVNQVSDLASAEMTSLIDVLGPKRAQQYYELSQGRDIFELTDVHSTRSTISTNINWAVRLWSWADAKEFIGRVAEENYLRLEQENMVAERMSLKLLIRAPSAPIVPPKYGGCGQCEVFTLSCVVERKTCKEGVRMAKDLFEQLFKTYQFLVEDIPWG
ncbi:hypothetical protein GEMRC1_006686 [Eukaryota sp. GEM-RC1]